MRRVAYETVLRACSFGALAICCMMVVRNPPVWNASLGMKDIPIITQKIASDANPQARSTVS